MANTSQTSKRNRKLILLAGLGAAAVGVAAILFFIFAGSSNNNLLSSMLQAARQQDDVIVALQPIERGSQFAADSIGRQDWPANNAPSDPITDEAETIGKIAKYDIAPGQIITRSMLMDMGSLTLSSPPIISNGVAYFGRREGLLFAADTQTNQEIWGFSAGQVTAAPAIAGDTLYAIGSDALYAIDAQTGQQIWRFNINIQESVQPIPPVVAEGVVYFRNMNQLYAIDATTGDELWHFLARNEIVSPLNVADSAVYFTDRFGLFYAVDVEGGQERWRGRPDWYLSAPSITVADGVAYFGRRDGFLYAVDTRTETGIWSFPAGQISTPPTVVDDALYVFGSGVLYALDAPSGQEIWRFDEISAVESEQISAPIVANNAIFFRHWQTLYAVNANTGQELWRFEADDRIVSAPEVAAGLVYFTDSEDYFYAVNANTGRQMWRVKPALPN